MEKSMPPTLPIWLNNPTRKTTEDYPANAAWSFALWLLLFPERMKLLNRQENEIDIHFSYSAKIFQVSYLYVELSKVWYIISNIGSVLRYTKLTSREVFLNGFESFCSKHFWNSVIITFMPLWFLILFFQSFLVYVYICSRLSTPCWASFDRLFLWSIHPLRCFI